MSEQDENTTEKTEQAKARLTLELEKSQAFQEFKRVYIQGLADTHRMNASALPSSQRDELPGQSSGARRAAGGLERRRTNRTGTAEGGLKPRPHPGAAASRPGCSMWNIVIMIIIIRILVLTYRKAGD